jgi:putative ABC transport system permease protein
MNRSYLVLSAWQVGLAALLIAINGLISVLLSLGLGRQLAIGAVRTVVQLTLVGYVLLWVFQLDRWPLVVVMMSVMTLVAGAAAVERTHLRHGGVWFDSIVSVWASSWLMTGFALFAVVPVRPWYSPQYAVPLLGMILGNALNGISLGLDRLSGELSARRGQIEAALSLGATRWEAARPSIRTAVSTGMIPTINSMMVVGIVSLPGMMTGQLLSGVEPIEAVKYQIVIMFLISSASALGTVGVILLTYRRLFTPGHQFLYHRLERSR